MISSKQRAHLDKVNNKIAEQNGFDPDRTMRAKKMLYRFGHAFSQIKSIPEVGTLLLLGRKPLSKDDLSLSSIPAPEPYLRSRYLDEVMDICNKHNMPMIQKIKKAVIEDTNNVRSVKFYIPNSSNNSLNKHPFFAKNTKYRVPSFTEKQDNKLHDLAYKMFICAAIGYGDVRVNFSEVAGEYREGHLYFEAYSEAWIRRDNGERHEKARSDGMIPDTILNINLRLGDRKITIIKVQIEVEKKLPNIGVFKEWAKNAYYSYVMGLRNPKESFYKKYFLQIFFDLKKRDINFNRIKDLPILDYRDEYLPSTGQTVDLSGRIDPKMIFIDPNHLVSKNQNEVKQFMKNVFGALDYYMLEAIKELNRRNVNKSANSEASYNYIYKNLLRTKGYDKDIQFKFKEEKKPRKRYSSNNWPVGTYRYGAFRQSKSLFILKNGFKVIYENNATALYDKDNTPISSKFRGGVGVKNIMKKLTTIADLKTNLFQWTDDAAPPSMISDRDESLDHIYIPGSLNNTESKFATLEKEELIDEELVDVESELDWIDD